MRSIDHHLHVWRRALDSLITLGNDLAEEEWTVPIGFRDWSVHDAYAHLVDYERWTLPGAEEWGPPPEWAARGGWPDLPVSARRSETQTAVLAELRRAYAQNLARLAAGPVEPHHRAVTPWGAVTTFRNLAALRAFDAASHLYEIGRALGRPVAAATGPATTRAGASRAGASGPVYGDLRHAFGAALLPAVRGVPTGSRVRLTAIGDQPLDVTVEAGPAGLTRVVRGHPGGPRPLVHLTAASTTWARLACGGGPADPGEFWATGDPELVRVVRNEFTGAESKNFSRQSTPVHSPIDGYVDDMPHHTALPKLGIVSTYTPRRCGLATYTADVRKALEVANGLDTVVVAIDRDGLEYSDEVVATIRQDCVDDYTAAADALRAAGVDVVLIQHEYGIFGGPNGSHVLALARALTERGIPYLVTLHTVLSRPSPGQAATLRALCARAARITVFTETARRMVVRTGIAAGHQIAIVPHGAPVELQQPPEPSTLRPDLAALLGHLQGKPTLTTFGLLSPGKGIDIAIDALAAVVERHPLTQYVVAGATHPEVVRHAGESYRDSLHGQVSRLGLDGQVHFVDAFLGEDELSAILHHTTLFVTPYRSPEQICSGALTFGLAAGCPAVSSSYRYAEDMLRYGAGRLVPCEDTEAFADAILELLDDPAELKLARDAAGQIGARITWPAVAVRLGALLREVVAEAASERAYSSLSATFGPAHPIGGVPALRLEHLDRLTDEIGIIQFATGVEPDLASGYCVDDVARLAIVAADLMSLGLGGALAQRWVRQSVPFLKAAYDPSAGVGLRNMMSYGGAWLDEPHLGDHVGRAMWSLGVLAGSPAVGEDVRQPAAELLGRLAPLGGALADLGLRSAAYALLGLVRGERPAAEISPLLDRLDAALGETCAQAPDWHWFEPELTYDNARLPQAMLAAAARLGDEDRASRAIDALDWYVGHIGLAAGMLRCVGNLWHRRDDDPAAWVDDGDEQPIDPGACVEALVETWQHTRDPRYARLAGWAHAWFLGRNRAGARVYAERTGGCRDGLSAAGPNENQGAESTLAYHQALLSLVGAGLAALPDRAAPRGAVERVVTGNRSSAGSGSALSAPAPSATAPSAAPSTTAPSTTAPSTATAADTALAGPRATRPPAGPNTPPRRTPPRHPRPHHGDPD